LLLRSKGLPQIAQITWIIQKILLLPAMIAPDKSGRHGSTEESKADYENPIDILNNNSVLPWQQTIQAVNSIESV
jgi:hypothetical protein